jgi:hypothetical protein
MSKTLIAFEVVAVGSDDDLVFDAAAFVRRVGVERAVGLARQQRRLLDVLQLAIERVAATNGNGDAAVVVNGEGG